MLLSSCCLPSSPCSPIQSPSALSLEADPLAILLPVQSTFLPSAAAHALHHSSEHRKEGRNGTLTSFIDRDCRESRLQMKGLLSQEAKGEKRRREAAGAGCRSWRAAQLVGSSDHIFLPVVGRMEQCLQLSSSALDCNFSFHLLPMSPGRARSFIPELWGLGVLFVLVVYSHRKPLKSLLRRRAFCLTDKRTCQSTLNRAHRAARPWRPARSRGAVQGLWALPLAVG